MDRKRNPDDDAEPQANDEERPGIAPQVQKPGERDTAKRLAPAPAPSLSATPAPA